MVILSALNKSFKKMYVKQIFKVILPTFMVLCFIDPAAAQIQKKRLPQNINIPTYSHVYPSVSADGQYMIFMSNYTNSGDFELKSAERNEQGMWENPEPILNINKPRLDHFGSFFLSHDGKLLLFSSARSRGIGGYDIWYSEKRGKYWSKPKNFGKPLNSTGHEGNPSLSPDGNTLYFMRCEKMDENNEEHCKVYTSKRKSASRWSDPLPLPRPINTGHELNPRIMIDNQTLVFASNRPGGKGKLDLYMSKRDNNTWSQPIALTYINTPKNDEFISLTAKVDIAYYTDIYKDKFNIYIAKIPEEYRPNTVILMNGKVIFEDTNSPAKGAMIRAFDMFSGKLFTATTSSGLDGSFFMALPQGSQYDFSVFPKESGYDYHVEVLQLDSLPQSDWIKPVVTLHPLQEGLNISLPTISFDENEDSTQLNYDIAIRRLAGFMQRNPGINVEISVFSDSIQTDTIVVENLPDPDTIALQLDSSAFDTFPPDSLIAVIDTTEMDSLQSMLSPEPIDPTAKTREQATAIKSALVQYSINPDRITATGRDSPNTEFEGPHGNYPKVILKIIE